MSKAKLLDQARQKVIVLDGGMGTGIQQVPLTLDDFDGLEGCNEMLVATRPQVIADIHAAFFAAGCDVVETNTFGANGVVLAEYGIAHRTEELNRIAAKLARDVADDYSTAEHPRYILGSVGPGTRLPSLGHISFDDLELAFRSQFTGLLAGGVDAVCIETCQDILQTKAAFLAAQAAFKSAGFSVPIFLSVTIETTGAMLLGSDVQTALAALRPLKPDVLGMNCGTGPAQMIQHVGHLSRFGGEHIFTMPNAGLPVNRDGVLTYDLTPDEFADIVSRFVTEHGVGIVGGCCGTTPEHLRALANKVQTLKPKHRVAYDEPEVSSLYSTAALHQDPAPLIVGERTNANGSRKFKERLLNEDFDGMLEIAQEQESGGAHVLDVSVAYVDRDEAADMNRFVPMLAQSVRLPLMIDSTSPEVIDGALKRHGGRCLINSINLEDGEERLHKVAELAHRFGAAVVALVIDETGMAMTTARKLAVAERILKLCREHGLDEGDLLFDMLTFTVASGDKSTRDSAVQTMNAIEQFKAKYPRARTALGVSNVSFGLKPAARRVLNSVFLRLAIDKGLDAAIINARGILPLHKVDEETLQWARRLLLDDQTEGDPLAPFMECFDKNSGNREDPEEEARVLPPDEALTKRVVDGKKKGLDEAVDAVLESGKPPVEIINNILIPAMKVVGDLFGSGKMQLPFVLQSAEVMKRAVAHLEPLMDKADSQQKGTLVLATVKGDVHDIGKNLVDIIVTNNGYKVVNLGIKISIEEMLKAVQEHDATALGMSGLLVKSTVVMKENLQEMMRRGIQIPVLLGGAALTRDFVEGTLRDLYGPEVHYCQDAFEGLHAMNRLFETSRSGAEPSKSTVDSLSPTTDSEKNHSPMPGAPTMAPDSPVSLVDAPHPPFLGSRVLPSIPLKEVFSHLNETTLFRGQWRYRRGTLSREEYANLTRDEIRPIFEGLKRAVAASRLFEPRAVYGYFNAVSMGNDTLILDDAGKTLARFQFPRKKSPPHNCISDYISPRDAGKMDIVGLFVVTAGPRITPEVQRLFLEADYRDYLHLHGLAVESAEATAEWLHRHMRRELGIDADDQSGHQAMVRQGYRGSRYSFGYPACPNLEDQKTLFQLLAPNRIGVELSESFQMQPEYSVSAVVLHHPDARYFNTD